MIKFRDTTKDVHPKSLLHDKNTVVYEFDNMYELIKYVEDTGHKGIDQFLDNVKDYKIDEQRVEHVSNTVRNNLIKRGIITGTIYEGYKYALEGDIIDYAELATGNPECYLKPIRKYDKYFYELYINMSIPYFVKDYEIQEGALRLLETVKALEERNIEIKINVILYSGGMFRNYDNFLVIIPLMSHLEAKTVQNVLPYTDSVFLRSALFAAMKKGNSVSIGLGDATKLPNTINLWELEDETELADRVLREVGLL